MCRSRARIAVALTGALVACALSACTTRAVPARYPEGTPASPAAAAPRAPAAAVALDEGTLSHVPRAEADAAAPHEHAPGAHHGH